MCLNIITITKDDFEGLTRTIKSTERLRESFNVLQIVIDSSKKAVKDKIIDSLHNRKNVNYYWQEPKGRSAAFNYGLKKATGKWVWFINGGDELNPSLNLAMFYNLLLNNNSDAIIFQLYYKQSNTTYLHPPMWAQWPPILSWIPHPSTITKRKLYDKFGFFNEKLKIAMDYEFWLRCFSNNIVVDLVSVPIAVFDQTGISVESDKEIKAEVRSVMRHYFPTIIKLWLYGLRILLKAIKINIK